ncbi:SBBP repeat beta-propeller lipoprotein, LipL53 family [Leptospira mayottensis]|uniref:SBBP repeat beta-propeller lipoprotein, LipL53 family n=1 Tax=Leptospira mayottensis TaxID=1137606 RepID=UPI0002BF69D8|nr:SBBP repeat-containing protein [Leptospira mayottensis]AXR59415.1 hypothetical protein DQM68_00415 [Leptospira mayottensis]AZQ01271.1 hypothetical protein LEP1GSC190_03580 [Leptospira mayottensis 200901116]TGN14151.1 hypothetical protein EHR03_04105 [Leptospira mayottensis]
MIHFLILFFILLFQACSPTSDAKTNNFFLIPLAQGNSNFYKNSITSTPEEENLNPVVFGENLAVIEEIPTVFGENPPVLEWTSLLEIPTEIVGKPDVAVDGDGSIYIAANSKANLIGDESKIGTQDIILKKFDSQQNELWMKRVGVRNVSLEVTGTAADINGNAYVTGYTNGPFEKALISEKQDMFVVKFNPDGTIAWKKQAGPKRAKGVYNTYNVFTEGITVDTFGNSYVVGISDGPFGDNAVGNLNGGFIIKFDANGNQIWVKQISILGASILPKKVALDENADCIYVVGTSINANFRTNTSLNYAYGLEPRDLFILKFDGNGNQKFFAQTAIYSDNVIPYSLAVDPFGNVLVGGQSDIDLESKANQRTNIRGFLIKYDFDGTQRWVKQFGPYSNEYIKSTKITGITTDEVGNIFTTGQTSGNTINEHSKRVGNQDIFLTKHNFIGQVEWIRQVGTPGEVLYSGGIGIDSDENLYSTGITDNNKKDYQVRRDMDLFLMKFR